MTDTTSPYGYIEIEITRLEHAEQKANREAGEKTLEAHIHMMNRIELSDALDKQRQADAAREI